VKLYDELVENGLDVEIVSIAGDRDVGLISDQKISDQLDSLVAKYDVKNAILVSDGARTPSWCLMGQKTNQFCPLYNPG